MTGTEPRRASGIINWVARIVGLIVIGFFLAVLLGESVTSIQEEGFEFEPEMLYIILPSAVALASYVLAWWHKTIGGWLLVFVSIIMGFLPTITARMHQEEWTVAEALQGWLVVGLPFLVTGALFLISAYYDRKNPA